MDENSNKKHFEQGFLGAFAPDQRFHDYILREYCGCGTYGEVWQAEDISGRLLAIKIVSKKIYGIGWQREFNGIKNYCRLISNHPNLIQIMHVGEDEQYFFYTMELADNLAEPGKPYYADTLADRLAANGPFPPDQLVILTKYLLNGIGTLHEAGLIHRDIKPANIIFVSGMPKLSDIGFVAQRDANMSLAGTVGFIPPEELLGDNDSFAGENTHYDIYAIGKVMYCALTRLPPDEFPFLPDSISSPLSKRLSQVIGMACCRNPSERIGSIDEFRKQLLMAADSEEVLPQQESDKSSTGLFQIKTAEKLVTAVTVVVAIVILIGLFLLKDRTETPAVQDSNPVVYESKTTPVIAEKTEKLPVATTVPVAIIVPQAVEKPSVAPPVPAAPAVAAINPAAGNVEKPPVVLPPPAAPPVIATPQAEKQNENKKDKVSPDYGPRADSPIWLLDGRAYQLFKGRLDRTIAYEKCIQMGGILAKADSMEKRFFFNRITAGIAGRVFVDGVNSPFIQQMPKNPGNMVPGGLVTTGDINNPEYDKAYLNYGFICEWENPETAKKNSPKTDTMSAEVLAPFLKKDKLNADKGKSVLIGNRYVAATNPSGTPVIKATEVEELPKEFQIPDDDAISELKLSDGTKVYGRIVKVTADKIYLESGEGTVFIYARDKIFENSRWKYFRSDYDKKMLEKSQNPGKQNTYEQKNGLNLIKTDNAAISYPAVVKPVSMDAKSNYPTRKPANQAVVKPVSMDAKSLAALPMPDGKQDPAVWQWSQDEAGRVLDFLGRRGEQQRHYPGPVIPKSFNDPIPRKGLAPDAMVIPRPYGMTYVNWDFGLAKLVDLSIDVTFHSKSLAPTTCYLQLYDGFIGGIGQYFGFQYIWENGKFRQQFIWSRWKTRDKADAWVAPGGVIVSSGCEGDFVSVRCPVVFDAETTFTVNLQMRETDTRGTWYELRIFDHQRQQWTKIGRLRFPLDKGKLPLINNFGGSWTEAVWGAKYSSDVTPFHMSYGGAYTCGRTVAAQAVAIKYSDKMRNSDVSIEPEGRRIHVVYGGMTLRQTTSGTYPLPPERPENIK